MAFKTTRHQGDSGVAAALAYYAGQGWPVSVPFGEGQRYDLIVDRDGELSRVQVKSAHTKNKAGNYQAELRTKGGNKSGTGKEYRLSSEETDEVVIACGDGTLWLFPIEELEGRGSVTACSRHRHRCVLQ
jgi:hypothetical protein